MKLAISGKGGTGKTTIAASLAVAFARQGSKVYAIDADPDANLASVLGITEEVTPLIQLKEAIREKVGTGEGFFNLNPDVDDIISDYSVEHEGVRVLQMGAVKRADSSCYCPENSFLRAVINKLIFHRGDVVIMDMGAGIEHLTRGTSQGVDCMLVVTQPDAVSLETALVIYNLALESGISRVNFVGNKVRSEREKDLLKSKLPDEQVYFMDYEPRLLEFSFEKEAGSRLIAPQKVKEALAGLLTEASPS